MHNPWLLNVIILWMLVICLVQVDAKRSFSIGRSGRKKAANISVRRKGTVPEVRPAAPAAALDAHAAKTPMAGGPPPAYPGLGHHSVAPYGAPPAYSAARANPPSYAEATGGGGSFANYPRQTYSANNSPGFGGYNAMGIPAAGHSTNMMGPAPGASPMYGTNYGYGSSSPFSMGNVLTGMLVWNMARGFNSHGGRTEHVYIQTDRDTTTNGNEPHAALAQPEASSSTPPTHQPQPSISSESSVNAGTALVTNEPAESTTIHPSLWTYAQYIVPISVDVVEVNKATYYE